MNTISKRAEELINIAKQLYQDKEPINGLGGSFRYRDKIELTGSNSHYAFCYSDETYMDRFTYDEEADTLANWGRGLGLIYRKGEWAKPRDRDIIFPQELNSYQIY